MSRSRDGKNLSRKCFRLMINSFQVFNDEKFVRRESQRASRIWYTGRWSALICIICCILDTRCLLCLLLLFSCWDFAPSNGRRFSGFQDVHWILCKCICSVDFFASVAGASNVYHHFYANYANWHCQSRISCCVCFMGCRRKDEKTLESEFEIPDSQFGIQKI